MKTRKIFTKLVKELENNKILLLVGPRQVGKTTLLKQLQAEIKDKKAFFLSLETRRYKDLLDEDPENIFSLSLSDSKEEQIIFVDEVQYLNNPSNFLKLLYDEYHENIKLIVSGSSSFYIDKKFKDSLMGRKRMFEIFTLDFEEFLDFKDEIALKNYLYENKKMPVGHETKLKNLFLEYITYGGYPEVVLTKDIQTKKELLGYLSDDYIKKDIYDANIYEVNNFLNLLKILSTQVGELLNKQELSRTLGINIATIEKYLYVMRKSYCIALTTPFWTNIRAELTKMPKVYFIDLGLRNSLLNNFENIQERFDKGQFFENVVWREFLFKYGFDKIKYWRNQHQNEIDLIIDEKKAYEVKFSKNLVKESKYKVFRANYPQLNLEFIIFEDFLKFMVENN